MNPRFAINLQKNKGNKPFDAEAKLQSKLIGCWGYAKRHRENVVCDTTS
jgi:hypothetical protein